MLLDDNPRRIGGKIEMVNGVVWSDVVMCAVVCV